MSINTHSQNIISVAVIAYNSHDTIYETLESIKKQNIDLKRIQIVISDDCSTDSTYDIATKWNALNGYLFHDVILIRSLSNQGVALNCTNAWQRCNGVWVKSIAADDILMPNCLMDNDSYVNSKPEIEALFSKCILFGHENGSKIPLDLNSNFFNLHAQQQYEYLLRKCDLPAPSAYIKNELLRKVGFADNRFPMLEDYPLWINFTKRGVKLHGMDVYTVFYRQHDSLSVSKIKIGNIKYIKSLYDFQRVCIWKDFGPFGIFKKLDDTIIYIQKYIGIVYLGNQINRTYCLLVNISNVLRVYRICQIICERLRRV